ncbi:MAG: hypothetical protein ACR2H0_00085 [Candidatus Limnocylindrales bacterium]
MAWVARIRNLVVRVSCGRSVNMEEHGFFEGTWSGPPGLEAVARASTVFGSGIVVDGRELIVVPPAHTLEPVYLANEPGGTLVMSNSLVGVLCATGRELESKALYPPIFGTSNRGLSHAVQSIPTTTDPITLNYFENIRVNLDGSTTERPKQRDEPFASFDEYRDRLVSNLRSAFANAPEYVPAVAMSAGYDSTAAAAVAAQAGCRKALTFRTGWAWEGYHGDADSCDVAADALGLEVQHFDRLAYQHLPDAPEAEFLATGMTGEDVVYRSMEHALRSTMMVSGYWGGAAWRGMDRANLSRVDLSGASLGEFRLRVDMIHVPLPYIGGLQQQSLSVLRSSPELRPYSVGGVYDEPVARRLAEEAGVPRGSFAVEKLAVSQRLINHGPEAMSPSGRASFESFAGAETLARLPRKQVIKRRHRAAIKIANALHAGRLVAGLVERKWRVVHFEPVLGSHLLRWAVRQIRPRYATVAAAADGPTASMDAGSAPATTLPPANAEEAEGAPVSG